MREKDSAGSPEPNACDILTGIQQRLISSIQDAVDTANRDAKGALEAVGLQHRGPSNDHYTFVALRHLFLEHCGADPDTSKGGDFTRAARLLHMGGRMSRYWEREKQGSTLNARREKLALSEEDGKDRRDWFEAAQNLALKTVVQTLVEHASVRDPALRDRATARVEDFIARLDPNSEQTFAVADWARASIARLLRPPEDK